MHYFLGIRPPDALLDSIKQFRQQQNWQGMEPHITVKAPCGLAGQGEWLPTIRQLCQATDVLPIEISGIGTFGSAVLFLRVLSPALLALHRRLLHELRISTADQEACYENARYSPHLTLLHQPTPAAYQLPMAAAATYFSETTSFRATELLVYSKAEGSIYQPLEAIPFGNASVAASFTTTT